MTDNKTILYLFGFSPFQGTQLLKLTKIIKEQIALGSIINIILIHDGVIGISNKGIIPDNVQSLIDLNINVYAMTPDMKARGIDLSTLIEQVVCIEYDELVDLMAESTNLISWM